MRLVTAVALAAVLAGCGATPTVERRLPVTGAVLDGQGGIVVTFTRGPCDDVREVRAELRAPDLVAVSVLADSRQEDCPAVELSEQRTVPAPEGARPDATLAS